MTNALLALVNGAVYFFNLCIKTKTPYTSHETHFMQIIGFIYNLPM